MKIVFALVLLLSVDGSMFATDSPSKVTKKELIRQDYERLTGTFRMVSGVIDGKEVSEDVRRQTALVTDHDKFTVSDRGAAGTSARGTFKIDPTKRPKTADSLQADGPDKGKTLPGIYEIIDENHKRACWAPLGKPRPKAFSSKPGSAYLLQVWERVAK